MFKASLFQAAYLFTAPAAQAARTVDALRLKLEESSRGRCLSHPAQALTEPPPGPAAPAAGHRSEGTATMAKLTTTELIDAFKELSLIELSEFVKAFEETFEVTAAAPVAVAAPAGAGGAAEVEAEEEKDSFDVVLEAAGDKKIQVIKEVRVLTSLGLKEAKDVVDAAPKAVLEGVTKEAAEKAKAQLEAAGATVTLK